MNVLEPNRLLAFADAADAVCPGCAAGLRSASWTDKMPFHHDKVGLVGACQAQGIRDLVEKEERVFLKGMNTLLSCNPTRTWREC